MALWSSSLHLGEPNHIVTQLITLKAQDSQILGFGDKKQKRQNVQISVDSHNTCKASLWLLLFLQPFSDLEWNVQQNSLWGRNISNICSVQYPGTWPHDATEHLKRGGCDWRTERFFHIPVEPLSVPCGCVSTLSARADPDWGGYYPVSSPGTPAASMHTPGKRLRELLWWLSSKESTCQCKRHERCGFDSWVKKNPSRREWQPTPGFLPGESHAERSLVSYTPSMGSQRVKHDWIELALTHTASSGKWHHTGYLKQNILHLFILPTCIAFIIVSWKAFCFKYSSVHMSIFKFQSLSLPMLSLCNSKFVL